jgi:Large ribosomal RNA subunit accumulation protein YceD
MEISNAGVRDIMNRPVGASAQRDPWRVLVTVAQIPETGLHRDIEADQAAREAMAAAAGLREISAAHASFDLALKGGGQVHVTGRVHARIGQTCVVTLDPIENTIDEPVDLTFAPADQIPQFDHSVDDDSNSDTETFDPPEPIENGSIDLGRLATDVLYLAIDPYPRKPDAVFEPPVVAADPEDHPFAALKALQANPDAAEPGRAVDKQKRKPNGT